MHTEDITLKCFELSPASFSWVKHTDFPDKDIVRVALTDARKVQNGGLVEGRAGQNRGLAAKTLRRPIEDGWMLTSAGLAWIEQNRMALQAVVGGTQLKEHRQKVLRRLRRLRASRLFAEFVDCPERFAPMLGQIAELLKCRVDAEPEVWRQRFDTIRRQAETSDQKDISDFINRCEQAYVVQS